MRRPGRPFPSSLWWHLSPFSSLFRPSAFRKSQKSCKHNQLQSFSFIRAIQNLLDDAIKGRLRKSLQGIMGFVVKPSIPTRPVLFVVIGAAEWTTSERSNHILRVSAQPTNHVRRRRDLLRKVKGICSPERH